MAGCAAPLRSQVAALQGRSERYRHLAVLGDDPATRSAGEREHVAIVEACAAGDGGLAALLLARHLARSALTVAAHLAPQADPAAVRAAVRMVSG